MIHTAGRFLLLTLLGVALGGCAQVQHKKQSNQLDTAIKAYSEAIRWGRSETALAMLKQRDGSRPQGVDPSYLKEVRVVSAQTRVNAISQDFKTADVTMTFDYYFIDQGNVQQVDQRGLWWFDEEEQVWFSEGRLPPFTR